MLSHRALLARSLHRCISTSSSVTTDPTLVRQDDLFRCLRVKCSAHEQAVLDSYEKFMKSAAGHLEIEYVVTETPFRTIKRKTMLASRFVHKKYRAQYEVRSYYRNLVFKNLTGSTMDTFLEYIQRNLPEGVLMIAEKHRLDELPFDLTSDQGDKNPGNK